MDIYRTNFRPTDYIRSTENQHVSLEFAGKIKKIPGDELKSMALYLQAAYAIASNTYSLDYLGRPEDMQHQLICHAIHEMRHIEIIGIILCKTGHNPQLKTTGFELSKSYKELFTMIFQSEQAGIESLSEMVDITNDKEIKLILLNQIREEQDHLDMVKQMSQILEKAGLMDTLLPLPQGAGPVAYDINMLQDAFELEIPSIVTLIYGSIHLGMDMSVAPRLRVLSIEDMQHLNRIAQDIITLGGRPVVTHESLNKGPMLVDTAQIINHAIENKQQKIKQYNQFSQMLKSKGAARTLLDISVKERESIRVLEGISNSLAKIEPVH